jgi:hypothetical protein
MRRHRETTREILRETPFKAPATWTCPCPVGPPEDPPPAPYGAGESFHPDLALAGVLAVLGSLSRVTVNFQSHREIRKTAAKPAKPR